MAAAMSGFAREVGTEGPVAVVGSGSRSHLGGELTAGTRVLAAPGGLIEHRRDELTVVVSAGTTLEDLEAVLRSADQTCSLLLPSSSPGTTVGSAVATARGGLHALSTGHMRDSVLGLDGVDAAGRLIRAGGDTVKNVSGFDLCRLLTGSLGTLVLIGAVTLRTRPLPRASQWVRWEADPFAPLDFPGRITSALWDRSALWLHLSGHDDDIDEALEHMASQRHRGAGAAPEPVDGPPALPAHQWSVDPARLHDWAQEPPTPGHWVAEMGVGTVHASEPQPHREAPGRVIELHRAIKERFDPGGRLAPGRSPLKGDGGFS